MIDDTDSPAAPAAAPAAYGPDEDVTTTLYRAAIGPVSNPYYLPIFTRFEAVDRAGISWNTAASLSTFNWLLFRKLWGAALAYAGIIVALVLLIFGIGRMVLQVSDTLIAALTLGFGLAAFVLPGLFGNAVFHADCRKRMARALVGHNTVTDACAELTRQAPTRRRAIVLFVVNVAAVLVAVFIYLQVSAFSTLTVMPHGALEVGQISVAGPTENPPTRPVAISGLALSSAAASSAAVAPVSAPSMVASAPLAPASSPASSPTPVPAAATSAPKAVASPVAKPASAPVAVARRTTASAPLQAAKPQRAASVSSMDTPDKPYFINVGLFAVPGNAAKAHAKLLEAQLPSVTRVLKSSKGPLTRVRVGPFTSREKALEAVEKIQALQLDAVIVQP